MGISIWESQEAFRAALPTLQSARHNRPSQEREAKPTEISMLNSAL